MNHEKCQLIKYDFFFYIVLMTFTDYNLDFHRFEGRLKRVCINRPLGLLAYDLALRKRFNLPFARWELTKIVI